MLETEMRMYEMLGVDPIVIQIWKECTRQWKWKTEF